MRRRSEARAGERGRGGRSQPRPPLLATRIQEIAGACGLPGRGSSGGAPPVADRTLRRAIDV
eukprot:575556-Prorocentrum_minimum.AAC.1